MSAEPRFSDDGGDPALEDIATDLDTMRLEVDQFLAGAIERAAPTRIRLLADASHHLALAIAALEEVCALEGFTPDETTATTIAKHIWIAP